MSLSRDIWALNQAFSNLNQALIYLSLFRLNPLAAGLNLSASLKADASSKEIEEAMRRVRETQSLISAAIEPGGEKTHHGVVIGDFVSGSMNDCLLFFSASRQRQ